MAHIDWTKSSSRVIQSKALLNKYDTDNGNIIYDASNQSSNTVKWVTDKDGYVTGVDGNGAKTEDGLRIECTANVSASATSANYLQIVGDKVSNGYPVDFQITNVGLKSDGQTAITFNMANNNSYNCIIKHDNDNEFPIEFYVTILKWSIPNKTLYVFADDNIETVITHIGFDVRFDLVENGMVASAMNPLIEMPYDGTNDLQYGIKISQFNLTLNKDTPATGYSIKTAQNLMYNMADPYIYNFRNYTTETIDNPSNMVQIRIKSPKLSPSFINGHKYYLCIKLKMEWNSNYVAKRCPQLGLTNIEDSYSPSFILSTTGFDINKNNKISAIITPNSDWVNKNVYFVAYDNAGVTKAYPTDTEYPRVEISTNLNNQFIVDLTEVFGAGNEPTKEWCDSHLSVNQSTKLILLDNNILSIKSMAYSFVSKSKFIVENVNNEYVSFGLKLDIENKFTDIGRYFVTATDYDDNGKTFNVTFKDNTKLLQENTVPVLDTTSISNNPSVNELFNQYINKKANNDININIENFDLKNIYYLPSVQYPLSQTYFQTYKKLCETALVNIYQDVTNIRNLILSSAYTSVTYEIHNNQCYSLKLYNNINNSINNVSYETLKYLNTGNTFSIEKQGDLQYTLLDGYMSVDDYNKYGDNAQLLDGYSWAIDLNADRCLVPKLSSTGNTTSGAFTISLSDYNSNKEYSIKILGARAEFVDGQTSSGNYVPSSDGKKKKYIHTKDDGTEVLVDNVSELTDNDYSLVSYSFLDSLDIQSSGDNIIFNYTITFHAKADSYNNTSMHYTTPIATQKYADCYYLGTYKIVLVSQELGHNNTTQTFTTGNGNLYESGENEFIQTDSTVENTGMSIAAYNANKILKEFRTNKSVVELEWIGSPYIRLNDVIKLDNGLSYRVYYIENKIDGGYRQKLKLVQKEDS